MYNNNQVVYTKIQNKIHYVQINQVYNYNYELLYEFN